MRRSPRSFKGWVIPGPEVPGVAASGEPRGSESLDALSGHFKIFQLKTGHRFSTDDILAAWYGTSWCPSARLVLDLGSGIGSVGMVAAWRLIGARFVTVEAQSVSVELARRSAAFNGLSERYDIRQGDFREPGVLGTEERFDLVLGSPPYFPLEGGVHGDHEQKIACRFEVRGTVADYCSTASKHLAPGGFFVCVFPFTPAAQHERVLAGAREAGLSIVRYRPVILKEGDRPLLALYAMALSEHLPERMRDAPWQEPSLVIRTKDGAVHPEYAAVKMSIGFPP